MKLTDVDKALIAKYGHFFTNTGGNDIVELIERTGVNYFNNPVAAELQGSCSAQLWLVRRFIAEGVIIDPQSQLMMTDDLILHKEVELQPNKGQ